MKLIRGLHNLADQHKHSVVTIGNFDGLHKGHQGVIRQLKCLADKHQAKSTVITFEPLPREYFAKTESPARLMTLRDKLIQLSALGVDQVLCIKFNHVFSQQPAVDFIQDILVDGLDTQSMIVGDDFRFGKNRVGDFSLLKDSGKLHGFDVANLATIAEQSSRISSTRVRQALDDADFTLAEQLIGRPFSISGRVILGQQRGRELGFPTANLHIARQVSPLQGVYAVDVLLPNGSVHHAVTNIGTRPTVDGTRFVVEVHLLNFHGNLYGQHIEIRWLKKIREEQRFASVSELSQQIKRDVDTATHFFNEK